MQLHTSVRRVSFLAAGALVTGALVATAPAAQAAPVFFDADTYNSQYSDAYTDAGACVTTPTYSPDGDVPIPENGAPVTVTHGVSATSANGGDTAVLGASMTSTSSVKSAGGNPAGLAFSATGSAVADFALPASGCELQAYAGQYFYFGFTVTSPVLLDLGYKAKGRSTYAELYINKDQVGGDPYVYEYGYALDFSGSETVLFTPGTYHGYALANVALDGDGVNVDTTVSGTVSVQGTFRAPGSQLQGASGKGTKYVSMPPAVNCAVGTVTPTVTTAKKAAKSVKSVKVYVNDALVKTVKKPGKGAAVAVSVAADQDADVTAVVTVKKPKKKGKKAKPAKVYEVSAAYESCTV